MSDGTTTAASRVYELFRLRPASDDGGPEGQYRLQAIRQQQRRGGGAWHDDRRTGPQAEITTYGTLRAEQVAAVMSGILSQLARRGEGAWLPVLTLAGKVTMSRMQAAELVADAAAWLADPEDREH